LAARLDAALKLSVIASLLIASFGVDYYYAIYLPHRDAAEADTEHAVEKFQAYGQMRADQERIAGEQRDTERRQSADKVAAENAKTAAAARYQDCVSSASAAHDASWASECKRVAEKAQADHEHCAAQPNLPQGYCDAAYRLHDASPNCTLPVAIATGIDADLDRARSRCLRDSKQAVQQ
jgi:hypothetical protein